MGLLQPSQRPHHLPREKGPVTLQIVETAKSSVSVSFTEAELILLNNALNEVLNGLDMSMFDARIRASRLEAVELLNQIGSLLSKMK